MSPPKNHLKASEEGCRLLEQFSFRYFLSERDREREKRWGGGENGDVPLGAWSEVFLTLTMEDRRIVAQKKSGKICATQSLPVRLLSCKFRETSMSRLSSDIEGSLFPFRAENEILGEMTDLTSTKKTGSFSDVERESHFGYS